MTESGSGSLENWDRIDEARTFRIRRRLTLSFRRLSLSLSDEILLSEHRLLLLRHSGHLLLSSVGELLHRNLRGRRAGERLMGDRCARIVDCWTTVARRSGDLRSRGRRRRVNVGSFRSGPILVLLDRERLRAVALRRPSKLDGRAIRDVDVDIAERLQSLLLPRHSMLLRHVAVQRVASIDSCGPFAFGLRWRLGARL